MPHPGQILGPYELQAQLGAGAFGEVWRACHRDLGTVVAVKIPTDPETVRQLRREGALSMGLAHPGIVRTLALDTHHDPPYLVTEYVDGRTLRELLVPGQSLPSRAALGILGPVLDAIGAAHAAGVTHRDLKPENLLVAADGAPRVVDFGLGRVRADQTVSMQLSLASAEGAGVSGTLAYMSPEQAEGAPASPGDDLYALGVIACELLTGARPRPGVSIDAQFSAAGADPRLAPVVSRALALPAQRFPTAAAMRAAFDAALAGPMPVPEPEPLRAEPVAEEPAPARAEPVADEPTLRAEPIPVLPAAPARPAPRGGNPTRTGCRRRLLLMGLLIWASVAGLKSLLERGSGPSPHAGRLTGPEAQQRQQDLARDLGVPVEDVLQLTRTVTLTMVLIPAGELAPGTPERRARRSGRVRTPIHPFWIGQTEVSQAQWVAVMGHNPSRRQGPDLPVTRVTQRQILEFIARLNAAAPGGGFRLPTEHEWEWACRAGSTTRFAFGDRIVTDQVNFNGWRREVGRPRLEARNMTLPVRTLWANAWGLYHMHGNVREWCSVSEQRVWRDENWILRGGSYANDATTAQSGFRPTFRPSVASPSYGVRLARELAPGVDGIRARQRPRRPPRRNDPRDH